MKRVRKLAEQLVVARIPGRVDVVSRWIEGRRQSVRPGDVRERHRLGDEEHSSSSTRDRGSHARSELTQSLTGRPPDAALYSDFLLACSTSDRPSASTSR